MGTLELKSFKMTEGGEWKKGMFREKANQNEGSMNNPHRNLHNRELAGMYLEWLYNPSPRSSKSLNKTSTRCGITPQEFGDMRPQGIPNNTHSPFSQLHAKTRW